MLIFFTPYGNFDGSIWLPTWNCPLEKAKLHFTSNQGGVTINGIKYYVSGDVTYNGRDWHAWPRGWRIGDVSVGLTQSAISKVAGAMERHWRIIRANSMRIEAARKAAKDALIRDMRQDIADARDRADALENELRQLEGGS